MGSIQPITILTFLAVSSLTLLVMVLLSGSSTRLSSRLNVLSGKEHAPSESETMAQVVKVALPKVGKVLVPEDEEKKSQLRARMMHAGLYHRQAMFVFLGVKFLAMVIPPVLGLSLGTLGLVSSQMGLMGGMALGVMGMIAPSFWLDQKKSARQTNLRRAMPDALDVLVICLEGGLALPSAIQRVAYELRSVHPLLAIELNIVQREVQMGQSPGQALWHLAERSGLEEILSLAGVIIQADRFGASLVKSLRVHADTLRLKRQQQAEEMAQKAGTKILLPTLFFIFPAIFVVILGPATMQVAAMFAGMNK